MDRYERILTLHRMLKSAHYPIPLPRLLGELECSRATLYRDVAFLRDALGAPIESAGGESAAFRYALGEGERLSVGVIRGLQAADQFEQLHHRHRIEEVHADESVRTVGRGGEFRHRDR